MRRVKKNLDGKRHTTPWIKLEIIDYGGLAVHKLVKFVFISALFFAFSVHAGPGHDHDHGHGHDHGPVTADAAASKAQRKVRQLVRIGKIDSSWADVKPDGVEQKTYSQGPEWVITFKNSKVADESKQTLYLFYSLDGHYIAANYTGN